MNEEPIGTYVIEYEEQRASGSVSWKTYKSFLSSACGFIVFLLSVLLFFLTYAAICTADYWVSYWYALIYILILKNRYILINVILKRASQEQSFHIKYSVCFEANYTATSNVTNFDECQFITKNGTISDTSDLVFNNRNKFFKIYSCMLTFY